MAKADFEQIFGIGETEGTQALLRTSYHRRMLQDLRRFVAAAGPALDRDLSRLQSRLQTFDGLRLSPGMALAHCRLTELSLAPQPVSETALEQSLSLLEEVVAEQPLSPSFSVDTVRLQDRWEREFVGFCTHEMDKAAPFYPDPTIRGSVETLPPQRLENYRQTVTSVLATLQRVAPSTHRDITELISDLRIFAGKRLRGASSPSYFGAVLIREPDEREEHAWLWFADHLTHEAAHHRLYFACGDDTLVREERTITSPVRSDPRPLSGVMHALWVEARLVQTFRALLPIRHQLPLKDPSLLDSYERDFAETLAACVSAVSAHAEALTPVGLQLLEHCTGVRRQVAA